ncbi:MAG: YwiC-like family protein [Chloroflexi bacterium]|nr:YwiC-like family protein [Chloroflexota bacterium]
MKTDSAFRLKTVALPAEHGGWAFLFEPLLLGLLVAPSWAAFWLSLSALAIFLIHQPLRTLVKDRLKGKNYQRTQWALRFTVLYGLLALLAFALTLTAAGGDLGFLLPLALAVPCAALQLSLEAGQRGRETAAEISGALALSVLAPAVVLIAAWTPQQAFFLWLVIAQRAVTSILYVRARLRLERGKPAAVSLALAAHTVALLLLGVLAAAGALPWLAALAAGILLLRVLYGLSPYRRPARAQVIGFQELAFGLLTVLLAAWGYRS